MASEEGKVGERAPSIARDAAPTKPIQRSVGKNSLYTWCGCNYEKDVIEPAVKASAAKQNHLNNKQAISSAAPLKTTASITTQSLPVNTNAAASITTQSTTIGNIVPETLFSPPAATIVDFLQNRYGFPIGLCKSTVIHAQSVPWRIVLVDCSTETETATVEKTGLASEYVYPEPVSNNTLPFFGPKSIPSDTVTNSKSTVTLSTITRWQEVIECLSFMAGLSRAANAITDFRMGSEVMSHHLMANPMMFAKRLTFNRLITHHHSIIIPNPDLNPYSMMMAKTALLPTPFVVGDTSVHDDSDRLTTRLEGRPGRTALCRDLMDIVTEITENGEALNDGNNNNDIIPPTSINVNKEPKEIQGFHVMPEQEDHGDELTTHVSVENGGEPNKSNGSSNNNNSSSSSSGSSNSSSNGRKADHSTMPSPSSPSSPFAYLSRSIRASIIIITDSIPADGEVLTALKALEILPVNVVIRLCTEDESVIAFWRAQQNKVPRLLMEILLDPWTEARRLLSLQNQWMLYAESVYRLREFGLVGVHVGAIDRMAEQTLAPIVIHRLVAFLYGLRATQLPPATVLTTGDWTGFALITNQFNDKEELIAVKAATTTLAKSSWGTGVLAKAVQGGNGTVITKSELTKFVEQEIIKFFVVYNHNQRIMRK